MSSKTYSNKANKIFHSIRNKMSTNLKEIRLYESLGYYEKAIKSFDQKSNFNKSELSSLYKDYSLASFSLCR